MFMKLAQYKDYRAYLRDELEERIKKNPSYSLRSFAQHLMITPQMLSYVLNSKKNISLSTAEQIAERLNLDPEESSYFFDLVALLKIKPSSSKNVIEKRINDREATPTYSSLDASRFKIISDWHHYAILELTQTKGFKSSPTWIAKRLGVKVFEVEQALDRLKELELLSEDSQGNLIRAQLSMTASYEAPNAALRKLAKQYLEKSIEALENQTMEERDITNITMSIDPRCSGCFISL